MRWTKLPPTASKNPKPNLHPRPCPPRKAGLEGHPHRDRHRQEIGTVGETVRPGGHRQTGETATTEDPHPHAITEARPRIHATLIGEGGTSGQEIGIGIEIEIEIETEIEKETGIGIEGGMMIIMTLHLDDLVSVNLLLYAQRRRSDKILLQLVLPHEDIVPLLLDGPLTVRHHLPQEDLTVGGMTVTATVDLVRHLPVVHLRQDTAVRLHLGRIVVVTREALHRPDTPVDHLARGVGVLHADVAHDRTLQAQAGLVRIRGARRKWEVPPRTGSSPVKEEPVHVKEEPVDGPMDLDRSALPPASVKHERSASPAKLQPEGAEANREASASGDAGPSPDRPLRFPHAHERRAPPTGPRGARPWDGERSPSRSVKAESPALTSIHRFKQEPSPYHRQNEGSMSPAITSPHPNHPQIPTGPSTRTGKPIPSGPRAANRAAAAPPPSAAPVKTEPDKPKVQDIEIPNRRRDWSYLPGHRERELLSQKLLMQQKMLQDVALQVIQSGWDLDVHAVELEGLKEKREFAERMFERASQGLTQDEAVDQNPAAHLKPSRAGSAGPSKAASTSTT
ncbi:hypothetical protein FS837_009725 [Tulasnella sp. UAMH 9824]|nr:hypothetical protein FS837_009725 [Tulasnella sp. UAMH 9824]